MKNLSLTFCLAIAALLASVGSGFASDLPLCEESAEIWNNCFGTWTWADGEKYVGEWSDNKKDGQGTTTWADGDKYVGEYKNGDFNGQGTYIFANGEKYVGELKDDKKHGKGTYTWANGNKYVGEHKDDKFHGQGTYTFADGEKYVGEFKDGKLNGYATRYSSDGTVKEGIWKDDEFQYAKKLSPPVPVAKTPTQGDEIISASSGSGFASDLPDCPEYRHPNVSPWTNCFGVFTWSEGDKYVGEFKDDKSHGQGTYYFPNGDKYVGEFKDDKKNGQGTYTFGPKSESAGDKYVGEYKDDKKNGQGTYTDVEGNKYEGDYRDDKRDGQGTITFVSGDRYVGDFSDGKKHGYGTFTFADGGKYFGDWKSDKKHGQGTETATDGRKHVGEWKNGLLNGSGIAYFQDDIINEGIWKNGKFQFAQKTPYSKKTVKPSVLRTAFKKLSIENRKQLQFNLKDLGFYKSSIDGLYGKGTAGALVAYNKQNLNGADLKKSKNVEKLINAVLALKPSPKVVPEAKPKEKSKPKRDLEKEFGLSLYGTFLHSEKVPSALFFFDEIEQYDSFEFRKALRTHDVDLIVLSSPGGSIFEGLNMAGIIHDKGLNAYVPKSSVKGDGNCASACSFMFFAGATRNVEGKLGVHQFLSKDSKKKEEVGDTQKTAQFTVSEIIGFLNEFETPAWVYERMFQQSDMYYFKETELVKLETEVSDELSTHYEKSETFISDFAKAFAEVAK